MRKIIMTTTLVGTILIPTQALASNNTHQKYHGVLPDAYYDALGTCETGKPGSEEPNWQHSTRSYTGGLGIHRQTFKRWSNHSSAKNMTPEQQVRVADAIAFRGHTTSTGEHVWRVGPWGWGCLKANKYLQSYICKSRHKLVQRWKRNC